MGSLSSSIGILHKTKHTEINTENTDHGVYTVLCHSRGYFLKEKLNQYQSDQCDSVFFFRSFHVFADFFRLVFQ